MNKIITEDAKKEKEENKGPIKSNNKQQMNNTRLDLQTIPSRVAKLSQRPCPALLNAEATEEKKIKISSSFSL